MRLRKNTDTSQNYVYKTVGTMTLWTIIITLIREIDDLIFFHF